MNNQKILENLKELSGNEFDSDDVICAFETEEYVYVKESTTKTNFDDHGLCTWYNAYTENSELFVIAVDSDNEVVDCWIE